MPTNITYSTMDDEVPQYSYLDSSGSSNSDSGCWTAFRANSYVLPADISQLDGTYNVNTLGNSTTYASVAVRYTSNCTQYKDSTTITAALKEFNASYPVDPPFFVGDCQLGTDIVCSLGDSQPQQCRMNVRMQAAFILAGCLFLKATYMIILNYRARGRTKNHCLTYGDVIVASVLDPDLKVKNEALLNSGDGYRKAVVHTCHKHCRDREPSASGDSIGHCQKCKKFNIVDMAADLPHPSIAIKYKRSLLSNLGSTAITQMIILMFTSVGMVAVSIMLIVGMATSASAYNEQCKNYKANTGNQYGYENIDCSKSVSQFLKENYGTWGGFSSSATLSSLSADSLGSEFLAFAISNGAQFLYSLLYLLLIYNLTLISMEYEWGKWELIRRRPRCTLVSGRPFEQSYFLQLPSRVLLPLMGYAALMHWLLGQAISTTETIYTDPDHGIEHSIYFVRTPAFPVDIAQMLTEKLLGDIRSLSNLHIHHPYGRYDHGMLVGLHLHSRRLHSANVRLDSRMLCFDNRTYGFQPGRHLMGRS